MSLEELADHVADPQGDSSAAEASQSLNEAGVNTNHSQQHAQDNETTGSEHTDSSPNLKFFVGGIHPEADQPELREYFSSYGQVLAVHIMRDHLTGRHRGFGFITLKTQGNSQNVFKDEHKILGQRVDVRPLQPDASANLRRKIFVGGLAKILTEDMLKEYFGQYGNVEKVTIMRQPDGTSRGFGFVVFNECTSSEKALEAPSHFVYGTKVDVRPAESRSKPSRQMTAGLDVYHQHAHAHAQHQHQHHHHHGVTAAYAAHAAAHAGHAAHAAHAAAHGHSHVHPGHAAHAAHAAQYQMYMYQHSIPAGYYHAHAHAHAGHQAAAAAVASASSQNPQGYAAYPAYYTDVGYDAMSFSEYGPPSTTGSSSGRRQQDPY